ncbi:MAG: beta-propeller fold lactonase family protein [Gemmatimonadota bacterium]|jgi:6-phosphogluconolactonase (cycloisomerase 2 family)
MRKTTLVGTLLAAAVLGACADGQDPVSTAVASDGALAPSFDVGGGSRGTVYTMTNDAAGNTVLAFDRAADGTLAPAGMYSTGGLGTSAGLGNQGGLVLSENGRWLFVVNAGSNDVSVFSRSPDGTLTLSDREPSGGSMPVSVTNSGWNVYVLNAGGSGNIAGLRLSPGGSLSPIAGSVQALSQAGGTGPAQIGFTRNGRQLVVAEKATNLLGVYALDGSGAADPGVFNASSGATPFGFGFDNRGRLIVSNAAGGAPNASSVSSYQVLADGTLQVLAGAVPDHQTAACWIAITRNGLFAYTTNAASNSTSGYRIGGQGGLSLLDANGVTGVNSGGPIDAAISRTGGEYLYVLSGGAQSIDAFRVGPDGSLAPVGVQGGLPAGTNGLAAS